MSRRTWVLSLVYSATLFMVLLRACDRLPADHCETFCKIFSFSKLTIKCLSNKRNKETIEHSPRITLRDDVV